MNSYAAAYLYALDVHDCEVMTDEIGTQEAGDVLRGFLANAAGWRGDQAREIKAELRRRLRGWPGTNLVEPNR